MEIENSISVVVTVVDHNNLLTDLIIAKVKESCPDFYEGYPLDNEHYDVLPFTIDRYYNERRAIEELADDLLSDVVDGTAFSNLPKLEPPYTEDDIYDHYLTLINNAIECSKVEYKYLDRISLRVCGDKSYIGLIFKVEQIGDIRYES